LMLSDVGVKLIERPTPDGDPSGIWDVWDIVGQENYPNVADMIQEIKKLGVSRRIAANEEFAKLSSQSKLILLHRRAFIANYTDYYGALFVENQDLIVNNQELMASDLACPHAVLAYTIGFTGQVHSCDPDIAPTEEMCLGTVYDDVVEGESLYDPGLKPRTVQRTIGDTVYLARHKPDGVVPTYELAIFGRFPIAKIDVIRDLSQGTHEKRMLDAAKSSLPISLEDE